MRGCLLQYISVILSFVFLFWRWKQIKERQLLLDKSVNLLNIITGQITHSCFEQEWTWTPADFVFVNEDQCYKVLRNRHFLSVATIYSRIVCVMNNMPRSDVILKDFYLKYFGVFMYCFKILGKQPMNQLLFSNLNYKIYIYIYLFTFHLVFLQMRNNVKCTCMFLF